MNINYKHLATLVSARAYIEASGARECARECFYLPDLADRLGLPDSDELARIAYDLADHVVEFGNINSPGFWAEIHARLMNGEV